MKKISMLMIACMMAMIFASCNKNENEEDPTVKSLEPAEQGTYMINTVSSLVDQIEADDFQPVADVVKKYGAFGFSNLIKKNPTFENAIMMALQAMIQPDSSVIISLPAFNGKYTIGKDSTITIESADDIQIIDKTGTKEYALALDYSGDTFTVPVSTGESKTQQIYAAIPKNIDLSLTCDGKEIAAVDLSADFSFHSTLDKFDSSKDFVTVSGLVALCGYILDITNASIKDSKINLAAEFEKNGQNLLKASLDINNVSITDAKVKNLGDASAYLSIMNAVQVKANAPSFLAVAALAQQYANEENPTQTVAQKYADQFNGLFTASVYYGSDVEQSQLYVAPYYSTMSEKWIFLPGVKIGDNVYTLSNYEGYFTQKQVEDLMSKIIAKVTDFSKLLMQIELPAGVIIIF